MPRAPAIAPSGQPALGDRCVPASRQATRSAAIPRRPAASAISPAVSRAGIRFATSSSRAATMPKASWRGVRWPIIESIVLIAL